MGRWSQYRHRGRGGNASAPGYSIAAPVSGNWEWTSLSQELDASMLAGCPLTVDGILTQYRVDGEETWIDGPLMECGGDIPVFSPCDTDFDYQGRIAWATGGVQVSDWSAPKTVTCTN